MTGDDRAYPYRRFVVVPSPGERETVTVQGVPAEVMLEIDAEAQARQVSRSHVLRERLAGQGRPPVALVPCPGCDGTGWALEERGGASPCATGPAGAGPAVRA